MQIFVKLFEYFGKNVYFCRRKAKGDQNGYFMLLEYKYEY